MSYIEDALDLVKETLTTRGQAWTPQDSSEFYNFEQQESIGIDPFQFALAMLNLKLNRAKNRWTRKGIHDADLEDSIKDLACYAVLAMGILQKLKAPKKPLAGMLSSDSRIVIYGQTN